LLLELNDLLLELVTYMTEMLVVSLVHTDHYFSSAAVCTTCYYRIRHSGTMPHIGTI
jgi:hypothetical protein